MKKRRIAALCVMILCCAVAAFAAITIRSGADTACGSAWTSCNTNTFGGTASAGDVLFVPIEVQAHNTTVTVSSITNNGTAATWNHVSGADSSVVTGVSSCTGGAPCDGNMRPYFAYNVASGITNVSFTMSGAVVDGNTHIYDISGLASGSNPLDSNTVSALNTQTCTGTSCPGISITNLANNEFMAEFGYMTDQSTAVSGTGWSLDSTVNGNFYVHRVSSAKAATQPTITTNTSGDTYCVSSLSFWDVAPPTAKGFPIISFLNIPDQIKKQLPIVVRLMGETKFTGRTATVTFMEHPVVIAIIPRSYD